MQKYAKKKMKHVMFLSKKSMITFKCTIYSVSGYGFTLKEEILENGKWLDAGSYHSTRIDDIQLEIQYLKKM